MAHQSITPMLWPYESPGMRTGAGWLHLRADGICHDFRDGLPFFWKDRVLPQFYRSGNAVWLGAKEGLGELAGICLETPDDIQSSTGLLEGVTGQLTLWLTSRTFRYCDQIRNAACVNAIAVHAPSIGDLKPLEFFPSLHAVYLYQPRTSDLSPLARHDRLEALTIVAGDSIRDLRPLCELKALRFLELLRGDYADVQVLSQLETVESLVLPGTVAEADIAAIASGCPKLSQLACRGAFKLEDLTVLRRLGRLKALEVSDTQAEDFSALEDLTRLVSLDLSNNECVSDLPALVRMPHLEHLYLRGCNRLGNLSMLCHMSQLRSLSLPATATAAAVNRIVDACPSLEQLELEAGELPHNAGAIGTLKKLRAFDGFITNVGALRSLPALEAAAIRVPANSRDAPFPGARGSLRQLSLRDAHIDCAPDDLAPWGELRVLSLTRSHVNCHSLQRLKGVVDLGIVDCPAVSDLGALRELTGLAIVSLRNSPVDELWNIEDHCILSACDLAGTRVRDLSVLSAATQLRELNLEGCDQIRDLTVLRRLRNLRTLVLKSCTHRLDLAPLKAVPRLARLSVDSCHWIKDSDLTLFAQLNHLAKLELGRNQDLTDLSPLARLRSIDELDLTGCTGITDIDPLAKLTELRTLSLSGCEGVSDFSPLGKLTNLVELLLEATNGRDITFIRRLPNLRYIDLTMSHDVEDITPLIGLRAKGCIVHFAERHEELVELDKRAGFGPSP